MFNNAFLQLYHWSRNTASLGTNQYQSIPKKRHTSIIELNKNFTAAVVLEKLISFFAISDESQRTLMHRFFSAHLRL